jgi:PPOX class probable F420-dependent enzyme
MAAIVPDSHKDLLAREKKAFAHLSMVTKDGEPRVWPMWFDYDGEHVIVNTARGRVKDKIMKRRPTVAIAVQDVEQPYRYIQLVGKIVDETEEGAYDSICDLAFKYGGKREYPKRPGEQRVIYKMKPERANTMG